MLSKGVAKHWQQRRQLLLNFQLTAHPSLCKMPLFFPWTSTPYIFLTFIHCTAALSSLSSEKRTISALLFAITFIMSAKRFLLGKVTLDFCIFHVHITVSGFHRHFCSLFPFGVLYVFAPRSSFPLLPSFIFLWGPGGCRGVGSGGCRGLCPSVQHGP